MPRVTECVTAQLHGGSVLVLWAGLTGGVFCMGMMARLTTLKVDFLQSAEVGSPASPTSTPRPVPSSVLA